MAGQMTLRVITPERIPLDETVETVSIPGVDGSIGILPRHAGMVAALDSGSLSWRNQGSLHEMFVSGGFCEVRDNTVRVVTELGERAEEIDEERARAAEERARKRLREGRTEGQEPIDLLRAQAALRRAIFRLRVKNRV